jgi:hypothetical protein
MLSGVLRVALIVTVFVDRLVLSNAPLHWISLFASHGALFGKLLLGILRKL